MDQKMVKVNSRLLMVHTIKESSRMEITMAYELLLERMATFILEIGSLDNSLEKEL